MKAVLLRERNRDRKRQQTFSFGEMEEVKSIEIRWRDVAENAKKNRTVFAQRRLKPEDVLPEWKKSLAALGGKEDVERFTARALGRLGGALEPVSSSGRRGFKTPLAALPEDVRERLEVEGLEGSIFIDFEYPPAPRCYAVQRSHPLVSVLAETILERTLGNLCASDADNPGVLGRIGCWVSQGITARTLVALVRMRHQLSAQRGAQAATILVEEATAIAWADASGPLEGPDALALLSPDPISDPPPHVRERTVTQALIQLEARGPELDAFAERRAQALLADHRRVREAAEALGRYSVKAFLPADVIGLFVLLPKVD
jgi:hypothetical protein